MTNNTVTTHSASTARGEESVDLIELRRLRSERPLIEAARDHNYHRWLADEELIGRLRLHIKHLQDKLTRTGSEPP